MTRKLRVGVKVFTAQLLRTWRIARVYRVQTAVGKTCAGAK